MISASYEPAEYLPYVDDTVLPENTIEAERQIRDELEASIGSGRSRLDTLHPMIDQILPLPNATRNIPLLNQEIERYGNEQEHETDNDYETSEHSQIIRGGIDLSTYSDFANKEEEEINYNDLYTTLSYSTIQERNLALLIENQDSVRGLQQHHLQELKYCKEEYTRNVNDKRQKIEEINATRKRRQLVDFKPVNEYLNDRWKESIKLVVDIGIEAARLETDTGTDMSLK